MQEEDRQVEIPEDIQKLLDRGDPKLKEFVYIELCAYAHNRRWEDGLRSGRLEKAKHVPPYRFTRMDEVRILTGMGG
jgi:hypothetical protein